MKYVLLFCGSAEDAAAFAAMTPAELRDRYAQVGAWFAEHRTKIGGTNYLQGPETAASVRFGPDGPPVVTDGPYLEGKEGIGGYAEIEVADLDEALRMAKTWPGRGTVEIRPVMTTPWNHAEIAAAADLVVRAARLRRPGPYQIQAAIVACHAEAPSCEATDWLQTLLLYDALLCHLPSPVTRLHRAIALSRVLGPQAALGETDALAADLDRYHLYHATRAELLRELGRPAQGRQADERALGLTGNPAERALLEQRLA